VHSVPLLFPFGLCAFFALFGSALEPSLRLFAFSPFFAFLYHRTPLHVSLWISALSGLLIDLISSETRLGSYALISSLTTLVLQNKRHRFFEDKPLSMGIFTVLISAVATVIQWISSPFFGKSIRLSLGLFCTDFVLMPLCDALYGFVLIYCPMLLFAYVKKVGWVVAYHKLKIRIGLVKPVKREVS
jgi:rod shape-determining protein MreD